MKNKKLSNVSIILALFILVIGALVFALIFWLKPNSDIQKPNQSKTHSIKDINFPVKQNTTNGNSDDSDQTISNEKVSPTDSDTLFKTGLENLPHSLQGTSVDGEIIIDENQQLVVTYGLRQLFDYFLSTLGEESAQTIHARVEAYIRSRTPEPAVSQAIDIYHNYINYLQALESIEEEFGSLQMQATQRGQFDASLIKQRKSKLDRLRQQFFDEVTIEAFFSSEDDLENYALAMMDIENNTSLTAEQKQSAKMDYISRLPKNTESFALQKYNQQQANIATLMKRTDELKRQGATAEQLYQMRVDIVGAAAAKRLADVDREEADFEQRFIKYKTNKQAIEEEFGDSSESSKRIAELENNLFNENEVRRLAGYEMVRRAKQRAKQKSLEQ